MAANRSSMRTWTRPVVILLLTCLLLPISAHADTFDGRQAEQSPNVRIVAQFSYKGDGFYVGSDLDFGGRYVYGGHIGRKGGVHIFDVTGKAPREVGFLHCPGYQNEVALVRPGLLALGYHDSVCSRSRQGIQLVDVRNPANPKLAGSISIPDGGTHTLTVYPGRPLIYSSPGGSGAPEYIVDVKNPQKPKIAAVFDPGPGIGCHDLAFHFQAAGKLAFCAGETATQIWDVSKPLKPEVLATIVNPLIWFHHSVAPTPDGKYLVVGDEGFGACGAPVNHPTGALFIYDISDPESPHLVSFFGLHREASVVLCTAHNFNFIPRTRFLVSSWYAGGMNVIDLTDPERPTEEAFYRSNEADYWSAYWYAGRVYASGRAGLDVFEIEGMRGGSG